MWQDYGTSYSDALRDEAFVAWRGIGARQKALNIVRVCSGIKVQSAIEIGCGTGAVLRFLHTMNFAQQYACVDVALPAVQFVQKTCGDFVQRAFVGLADALPFQDAVFDVAILTHVVEHLQNPVPAIREAARVAGYVVIEVPIEKVLSNMIRTKVLRRPYASAEGAGHVQFWSPKSVLTFLEQECGLTILEHNSDLISKEIEFYGKRGLKLAKPLFKQTMKAALPDALYSRLLTTHATFLCTGPRPQLRRMEHQDGYVPLGSLADGRR
jgi:SAM-dependent methyltransferase